MPKAERARAEPDPSRELQAVQPYGLRDFANIENLPAPRPEMGDRPIENLLRLVDHERIRPSQLAKWVNRKYSGDTDSRDHVAAFMRVVRAEQVHDFSTQFQGFGRTLEDDAATWFDSVEEGDFNTIQELMDEFIEEFSQGGIAHNTVLQIHTFKQKENESARKAAL